MHDWVMPVVFIPFSSSPARAAILLANAVTGGTDEWKSNYFRLQSDQNSTETDPLKFTDSLSYSSAIDNDEF